MIVTLRRRMRCCRAWRRQNPWRLRSPRYSRRGREAFPGRSGFDGEIRVAARSIDIEWEDAVCEQFHHLQSFGEPLLALAVGERADAEHQLGDGDAGEKSVSAACSSSQARTASSGAGFIASDTTLVSRRIIRSSSAWRASCRVIGRGRRCPIGQAEPAAAFCERRAKPQAGVGANSRFEDVAHLGLGTAAVLRGAHLEARCVASDRFRIVTAGMIAPPAKLIAMIA
jgi:hypothetical protein